MEELTKVCKEIIDELDWFENNYFESEKFENDLNNKFKTDKIKYGIVQVDETDWEDTGYGKYYSQNITYQLVKFDSTISEYPANKAITEELNIYFNLSVTKTGSYYTDWYYNYDKPTIMKKEIIQIPEQIIPAHEEERMVEI